MQFSELPIELMSYICDYLCFIDKYCFLTRVSKEIKNDCYKINYNFNQQFKKQFVIKLNKNIFKSDNLNLAYNFCDFIKKNNMVISGSFILDVLFDMNKASDLDIYEKYTNDNKKTEYYFLKNTDANKHKSKLSDFEKYYIDLQKNNNNSCLCDKIISQKCFCSDTYNIEKGISFCSKEYFINDFKIQHTLIGFEPRKYINLSFDMDICKNYFDGENIFIKNLNKIISKKDYLKPISVLTSYLYYNAHLNIDAKRLSKYKNKGFDIEYHPKFDDILKKGKKIKEDFKKYFLLNNKLEYNSEYIQIINSLIEYSNL